MMTLQEYIEKGKELIADWQWAYNWNDRDLMNKIVKERQKMELEIMDKGDDFYYDYYMGINNLDN